MKARDRAFIIRATVLLLSGALFVFLLYQAIQYIETQKVVPHGNVEAILSSSSQQEHKEVVEQIIQHNIEKIGSLLRPPIIPDPPSNEKGLPYEKLLDIIQKWNPDDPEVPPNFQEKLQHFNFGDPYERSLAEKYRSAELPFKVYNVTEVNEVVNRWSDGYLITNLASISRRFHVEKSKNNHFMFWSHRGMTRDYVPPTEIIDDMTFEEWLVLAKRADELKLGNDSAHYYFMAGADPHEKGRTFISRDLSFFSSEEDNFFITNVRANKGIQCRFGMRGVIAESHYDSGRNMVAMIRGEKRYILSPPRTCDSLGIIADRRHPSFRHSLFDWSDPIQSKANGFDIVDAIDTVIRNGEVLYIPSFWFHYIISLKYSIQCNSRSGFPPNRKGQDDINKCFHQ